MRGYCGDISGILRDTAGILDFLPVDAVYEGFKPK
jgi:hypothetical protein